jgi:MoaA/NifB/PqqE/SkfB family radical SAM enzyme
MPIRPISLCSVCTVEDTAAGRLQHCIILVTEQCNLRCRICGYGREPVKCAHEMPTRAIVDLIVDAHHLGCDSIVLTGGEPLLRKDLVQVFEKVCKLGIESSCAICTNGTNLDRETARRIAAAKPSGRVVVSLDGPSPAIHDRVRGSGAFERAVAAIDLLNDAFGDCCHVSVNTIINRLNANHLTSIVRLLAALGVHSLKLAPAFGPSAEPEMRLTHAELLKVCARAPALQRLGRSLGLDLMDLTPYALLETASCRLPSFACFVDSLGGVYGCNVLKGGFRRSRIQPLGVFRRAGDLERIWASSRFQTFRRRALAKAFPDCLPSCADVTAHAMNFHHGPCGECIRSVAQPIA